MNRLSVMLSLSVLLGACKSCVDESLFADCAKAKEQRVTALKRELGECHAQLAKHGSTQSGSAPVAEPSSRTIIDLVVSPYLPDGWEVRPEDQIASRVQGDTLEFDPAKIRFHLDSVQQGGAIVGTKLKKQLEGQSVLPAQVLDHLLVNTGLIPDSWKQDEHGRTRYIYFWGTIYRDRDGYLYVRCLCWGGGQWSWDYRYLADDFGAEDLAAILAS